MLGLRKTTAKNATGHNARRWPAKQLGLCDYLGYSDYSFNNAFLFCEMADSSGRKIARSYKKINS